MTEQEAFFTAAGLRKLQADLIYLREIRRRETFTLTAGESLCSSGLLAAVESRIRNLEYLLDHAQIIDARQMTTDQVRVGHRVRLRDEHTGEELEYMLVSSVEADPSRDRISYHSPVAQAILGCKAGDTVEIEVPAGKLRYRILAIDCDLAG